MGYKSINRLVKDIHASASLIESGELSVHAMDVMINNVQSLEERLYILRYKIQEQKRKSAQEEKPPSREEAEIPVLFKVEPITPETVHPNQRTIIDVIEEIEEERKPLEVQSALFGIDEEQEPELSEEIEPQEKEIPKKEKSKDKKKKNKEAKTAKKTAKEKQATLVEKLNSAPIHDLKKSINLNLKFRFIKVLYQNDSEVYNKSIEEMNQASSLAEAKKIFYAVKESYQWEEELEEETLLLELLDRKFES